MYPTFIEFAETDKVKGMHMSKSLNDKFEGTIKIEPTYITHIFQEILMDMHIAIGITK